MDERKIPLVSMRGIDKIFYGAYANKGVDFDLYAGEVHSLLGENGAGKTTLMNCLAGLYLPDAGTILRDGRPVVMASPRAAIENGVGMVHQHFMLVPVFSVWENMVLGLKDEPVRLDKKKIIARIRELSEKYGLHVDPEAKIWQLSIGEQQRVEILKMLYRGTPVLILDEPTSVLTPQETRELFRTVGNMVAAGHGVVLISHKIEEIMEVSDRLTVLRKGVKIATAPASDLTREQIAEMMVGRRLADISLLDDRPAPGEEVLCCSGVCAKNDRGAPALASLSLSLRAGEILGIAGVDGNGQDELCEILAGLRMPDEGAVTVLGRDMTGASAKSYIGSGVSYIPADRKGVGLVPNMNVEENISLKKYWEAPIASGKFFIDWKYVAELAAERVRQYDVVAPSMRAPVRVLSGGNLQKLMLSREITEDTKIIIAMQPTWGLDVGAAEFVHERLIEARDRGVGVLLVSKDLNELQTFSDRIAVISGGAIVGVIDDPRATTLETIGLMMAGVRPDEK
ncbi:ABC transporter ATP-binding protein [Synergistaceae bacterium OttesenSCG-928-D05]|nr:ABC transporter ATP-binding protein [Synergistaceae bacterium OttesenSCG-928-D05]